MRTTKYGVFLLTFGLLVVGAGTTAWAKKYSPAELRKAKFELIAAKKIFHTERAKGWEERDLGKYQEVIRKAQAVVRKYPDTEQASKARNLIIRCYEDLGQWRNLAETMADHLKTLEKSKGKEAAVRYARTKANESYRAKDYEKAIELYNIMEDAFPEDTESVAETRYFIARSRARMGRSDKAVELLTDLVKSNPAEKWNKHARLTLGHTYLVENQQTKAIEVFREFLKKYPKD